MTWQTRLAGYVASGATVAEAFDSIEGDLDTMREVALADAGCPEEVSFIAEMYAEDKAKLVKLRATHVDAVSV